MFTSRLRPDADRTWSASDVDTPPLMARVRLALARANRVDNGTGIPSGRYQRWARRTTPPQGRRLI